MFVRWIVVLFLALGALAQTTSTTTRRYRYFRKVTGGTVNRISIRQPASGARPLQLQSVWFKGTAAFTWTIYKNGTVSGGTEDTLDKLDDRAPDATAGVVLDGTLAGSETVSQEVVTAAGDRSVTGGLRLAVDSGDRKMITLEITASSSDLTIYVEVDEP